ncbi:MAG: hypothetical protein AAF251_08775 [Pseudomonadota bacterium]
MRSQARLAFDPDTRLPLNSNDPPLPARSHQALAHDEKWPLRVRALIFIMAPIASWSILIYAFQKVSFLTY